MTPSPITPEVYEIYDISYSHMADLEEDIWISIIEEKLSFHSIQKFSNDYSIINYVHSLPVIAPRKGEEFDFSISNDGVGVQISNCLDILEIISYCRTGPFTLIDLELPTNSYMISCTDTQIFVEEEENCASTISVEHTLGSDLI